MSISVIIPNWNAGDMLREAVLSIADDPAVGEIIVVDNASTDGSADRLAELDLPQLVLICNDQNVGATKARHIAVQRASYEIIAFLDADDLLSTGALSNALRHLIGNDLDICNLQMVRLFPDGHTEPFIAPLDEIISGQEAFRRTLDGWKVHPMGVMRRSIYFNAIDSFTFHGHSDDELLTRHLFLSSKNVGGVKDLYIYRITPKPPTMHMTIGQLKTGLAVLELSLLPSNMVESSILRKQRSSLIRTLLSLLRRRPKYFFNSEEALTFSQSLFCKKIPCHPVDYPHFVILFCVLQTLRFRRFFNRTICT